MNALIDHLATDRVRGARLVLAYGVGIACGAAAASAALLAVIT
jgi:hypothetical protein